jgi:L-2,4-diaminobutyrate decarboxylase
MLMASKLAEALAKEEGISLWAMPKTGVTVFRPISVSTNELYERLPEGMLSTCMLDNEKWLRSVAANPLADLDEIVSTIQKALRAGHPQLNNLIG